MVLEPADGGTVFYVSRVQMRCKTYCTVYTDSE